LTITRHSQHSYISTRCFHRIVDWSGSDIFTITIDHGCRTEVMALLPNSKWLRSLMLSHQDLIIIRIQSLWPDSTLSESGSLPSARHFAECFLSGTWQVSLSVTTMFTESGTLDIGRHSIKTTLPSDKHSAKGGAQQRAVSSRL
jgi:hypothetical protein